MKKKTFQINSIFVFVLAFCIAFLCLLPFLIKDGGRFLYFGDYNIQQLPFYQHVHTAIRNGNFFLDLNTDLGSSLYSSYSFYLLGSPFFLITLPFPTETLPYLMPVLLMFKIALGTLGAYLYTRRYVKKEQSALIGGLLYGFSGFIMLNVVFNHFLDVTALFPFYLLAFEKLVENKKRGTFIFFTTLLACTNYFFFFGEVVFLILYFVIRYCMGPDSLRGKELFSSFLRIFIEGILGVMLSCFLLLPSLMAVLTNSRVNRTIFEENPLVYTDLKTYGLLLKNLFFMPDLINKPTLFAGDTTSAASVSLFLPLFSISGVIAFFIIKKGVDFRKRLCVLCVIMACIPVLNSVFAGLNATYYARWFYMPILILAMMSSVAVEEFDTRSFGIGTGVCAGFYGIFLLIYFVSKQVSDPLNEFLSIMNRSQYRIQLIMGAVSLFFLVYLTFVLHKDKQGKYLKTMAVSTVLVAVLCTYLHLDIGYKVVGESARETFVGQVYDFEEFTLLNDVNQEFYRIEFDDDSSNFSMFWEMPSISCFMSTVNGNIMDFYEFAGIERIVKSQIPYDRPGIRSLLSVRYFLQNIGKSDDTGFVSNGLLNGYEKIGEENEFAIYENSNALHMGMVFSFYMKQSEYEKLSDTQKDLALVCALVVADDWEPESGVKEEFDLTDNSDVVQDSGLTELTAVELERLLTSCDFSLATQCSKLNATAASSFCYDDDGLSFTFDNSPGGLMFLSIPYSEGFEAMVDGEKTQIIKVEGGLMALQLSAGNHEVNFRYTEPGLGIGIILSIVGLLLSFIYLFGGKKFPDWL